MSVKVRELRKGKFYLVVHYKGRRAASLHGPSREKAEESAKLMDLALRTFGFQALKAWESQPAARPTLAEYAERWLTEIENSTLSRSTITSYSMMLKKYVVPALGWHRIGDLRYGHIKAFALKQAGAYARDTVRLMLAATRAMLEEAVREELIERNPAHGLSRLYRSAKRIHEDVDVFTLEELHRLERVARERFPEYFPFILCLSRTGMRAGEAIALRWEDVDFEAMLIHVRRNMPSHGTEGTPKTRSGIRGIEISAELGEALRELRANRKAEYLRHGRTRIPDRVFLAGGEAPIRIENFRNRVWNRILSIAGLRHRRIHDLRHTFATLHLSGGASVVWVKEQLGHATIRVTVDTYKHVIPEQNRDRSDRLDLGKNANNAQTDVKWEEDTRKGGKA